MCANCVPCFFCSNKEPLGNAMGEMNQIDTTSSWSGVVALNNLSGAWLWGRYRFLICIQNALYLLPTARWPFFFLFHLKPHQQRKRSNSRATVTHVPTLKLVRLCEFSITSFKRCVSNSFILNRRQKPLVWLGYLTWTKVNKPVMS